MSLPEEDVAILDEYAHTSGLPSRSAALQQAIHLLRHADLEKDYASAWDEWESSARLWGKLRLPMGSPMHRGEVRLIDLEPARGSEANTRRPGIIVSNDRANATADRLGRGS